MPHSEQEPTIKRISGKKQHTQLQNEYGPGSEEQSEEYSNASYYDSDYSNTDDDAAYEEEYEDSQYANEGRKVHNSPSPRSRAKSKNKSSIPDGIQGQRRGDYKNTNEKSFQYADTTQFRHRKEEPRRTQKQKYEQKLQSNHRQRTRKNGKRANDVNILGESNEDKRGFDGHPAAGATTITKRRKHTAKEKIRDKVQQESYDNVRHFNEMDTLNDVLSRNTLLKHSNKYLRPGSDNLEYSAILDDYSELYKARITIPEEEAAILRKELKNMRGQLLEVQEQMDEIFTSALNSIDSGNQSMQRLVSTVEGLNSNMGVFCKSMDARLRETSDQIVANKIVMKNIDADASERQRQRQRSDEGFLELLDNHLKNSFASYFPAHLQPGQKMQLADGAEGRIHGKSSTNVSVLQFRAPLPLVDSNSIEEKYKALEQKYNRALVVIKAMRLATGLDCVPVNAEADYVSFMNDLEDKVGRADRDLRKGKYMIKIRCSGDEKHVYTGYLNVTADDNILLQHSSTTEGAAGNINEHLKKDMVMTIDDLPFVVHEIYESLMPQMTNEEGLE